MQITVTFNSLEEFFRYIKPGGGFIEEPVAVNSFDRAVEHVQKIAQEAAEASEGFEPDSAPFDEAPAETATTALTEDFRAEVRRELYKLKAKNKDAAKAIVTRGGYKNFAEIPLEKLPEIMAATKEALNA